MNKSKLLTLLNDSCIFNGVIFLGCIRMFLPFERANAGYRTADFKVQQKNVDYGFVQQHAKVIFDTKNVMKAIKNRDNIEVL